MVSSCQTFKPCNNAGACRDLDSYNETMLVDANGTAAIYKISHFECDCLHNFDGVLCEYCEAKFTNENCTECVNTNFTGTYCNVEIPCTQDPCYHDFNCTNNPEEWIGFGEGAITSLDYTCHCNESWTGKNLSLIHI